MKLTLRNFDPRTAARLVRWKAPEPGMPLPVETDPTKFAADVDAAVGLGICCGWERRVPTSGELETLTDPFGRTLATLIARRLADLRA